MAWGSIVSHAPAARKRVRPSWSLGLTTRMAAMAVVRIIAASAEAAASKACCEVHHGGKATATSSTPGPARKERAATAITLTSNSAVAFSQAGQRDPTVLCPGFIGTEYREGTNYALILDLRSTRVIQPRIAFREWRPVANELIVPIAQAAGTGSAVTDLIFSIANREVTFFSATVPISFL
jgi:hypothetical protein